MLVMERPTLIVADNYFNEVAETEVKQRQTVYPPTLRRGMNLSFPGNTPRLLKTVLNAFAL